MNAIRTFFWQRFALNAYVGGDYATAFEYFQKIHRLRPEKPGLLYNMGLCRLGLVEYDEAERWFLEDLYHSGPSAPRLRTLGDLYYLWGKREDALRAYEQALELSDDDQRHLLRLRLKNLQTSERYEQVLEAHRHFSRGLEAEAAGENEQAAEAFALAAVCDPSHFQALHNLGVIALTRQGDPLRAVEYFQEACRLNPTPSYRRCLDEARHEADRQA